MDKQLIQSLLEQVKAGHTTVEEALVRFRHLPFEDMDFAKVDHHRQLRNGIMEVVYGESKQPDEVIAIARHIYDKNKKVLITRVSEDIYKALSIEGSTYHTASRIIEAGAADIKNGSVLVVCAGTSDIPVAEEAAITAAFFGSATKTIYDIGVAGLHRLFKHIHFFDEARVIVVVAGMEGALPSVIGGLTDKPLIAVPTSVGYGASLHGLTALFAMLNSCVPGIAVMNINNGFGAGCLAHKINMIGLS
ncbi:MAG: nickel pincer cofactor biosynthesis protein LarB [Candidatus Magnetoovum sp. WYHC-5]|nr:nickel pincer cofactor biosynthesis protein LarB [Candidatus Magnetoovum sp. WYHC-5]